MTPNKSVAIIGSGVIGLTVGIALLKKIPGLKVTIHEKEKGLGYHASGRNSGVIHAGFYYSPESLKAKFCRDGNEALVELITNNNLSVKKTGKIVVTKSISEVANLLDLHKRGLENGVELELLQSSQLKNFEPLAQTVDAFLWSPSTCVASPQEVIQVLAKTFEDLGGTILFKQNVERIDDTCLTIDGNKISVDLTVNCSGTNAIKFAHDMGVGHDLAQLPFIGLYRFTEHIDLPLRTLVYPVPDKNYPFLGVHFTISIDGKTKIGPTAIPVISGEQYTIFEGITLEDLRQSTQSIAALAKRNLKEALTLARMELPNLHTQTLLSKADELVPGTSSIQTWKKYRPGIRAQLVETNTGKFLQDFRIEKTNSVLHVLNSVSPGWTSAIPFGRWLAQESLELLH
jgi:L-2-hydroxyglutarate oxidase